MTTPSLYDPGPDEHEPEVTFRCPACGFAGTPDDFDALGADEDHVICNRCNKMFDPSEDDRDA